MRIRTIIWITAIIILGGALVLVLVMYRSDLRRGIRNLEEIQSQVFRSKQAEIEFLLEGSGPTVLISHGITGGID